MQLGSEAKQSSTALRVLITIADNPITIDPTSSVFLSVAIFVFIPNMEQVSVGGHSRNVYCSRCAVSNR